MAANHFPYEYPAEKDKEACAMYVSEAGCHAALAAVVRSIAFLRCVSCGPEAARVAPDTVALCDVVPVAVGPSEIMPPLPSSAPGGTSRLFPGVAPSHTGSFRSPLGRDDSPVDGSAPAAPSPFDPCPLIDGPAAELLRVEYPMNADGLLHLVQPSSGGYLPYNYGGGQFASVDSADAARQLTGGVTGVARSPQLEASLRGAACKAVDLRFTHAPQSVGAVVDTTRQPRGGAASPGPMRRRVRASGSGASVLGVAAQAAPVAAPFILRVRVSTSGYPPSVLEEWRVHFVKVHPDFSAAAATVVAESRLGSAEPNQASDTSLGGTRVQRGVVVTDGAEPSATDSSRVSGSPAGPSPVAPPADAPATPAHPPSSANILAGVAAPSQRLLQGAAFQGHQLPANFGWHAAIGASPESVAADDPAKLRHVLSWINRRAMEAVDTFVLQDLDDPVISVDIIPCAAAIGCATPRASGVGSTPVMHCSSSGPMAGFSLVPVEGCPGLAPQSGSAAAGAAASNLLASFKTFVWGA